MDFPGKSLSIRAKQRLLGGRGHSWDEDNDIWTVGGGVRDKEGMRERERERERRKEVSSNVLSGLYLLSLYWRTFECFS